MNYNGRWGYGWFLNYDSKIKKLENDNLLLVGGDGAKNEYTKTGVGVYASRIGFDDTLMENGDGTYTRILKNGVVYDFDVNGCLSSITDRNGNAISFEYDEAGKLPINGASAFFVSQTTGVIAYDYKLVKIIDTVGREVLFAYDADGRLTTITDPAGREFAYAYDGDNNLVRAYEAALPATPLSNRDFYAYAYDDKHNLISVTKPNGTVYLENQYNEEDRVAQQTSNGETSVYEYDPANSSARRTLENGSVMTFQMNSCCGNPTKVVRDAGEGRLNLTWTYTYDSDMNMTSATDPRGFTTYYEYDDHGNVTKVTDPASGVTRFEYEQAFFQITKITDPLGRVTALGYDSRGNLLLITDAMGYQTNFNYDPANGDLLTMTNAASKTTQFSYDAYGNIATITDALNHSIGMTYNILGNLLTVTDQNSNQTQFAYDVERRLAEIEDALGNITRFTYDKNGNRKTITDPLNHTTTFGYDGYDRLLTIKDALNHVTAFTYDVNANLTSVTDAENNAATFEYDTWNRRIRSIDALGQATDYAYDANGNLISITDANTNATTYEYDSLNRRTKTTYPDGSYEEFSYDAVGNLVSKRNRDGRTVSYAHDNLNRLRGVTYPDAAQISYMYDSLGRMTRAADSNNVAQYVYDALNRVTQVTQDGRIVRYEYDAAGNRTKLTYPDGTYVTYVHDALNRLDQIKNASGQALADYAYDAASRRTQADFLNGTRSAYGYDMINLLQNLTNKVASTQAVISSFAYAHDNVGNRTSMTTPDGVHGYTYDKTYQLTGMNYPAGYPFADTGYNYDALGNRTSVGATTYSANELNQYAEVNGVAFSYDGRGNLTGDGVQTYAYDHENRMVQANTATGPVTFDYDAFGRRVKKTNSAGSVLYVYDGDQVIAEYGVAGNLLRKFVYGTGIDEPVVMESGGSRYFYHFDGLGSVAELTGAGGAVVEEYGYDVYGKVRMADASGNVLNESGVGNPYFFTGRRYDADTGLYYYRARSYSSEVGRFLQVDPLGYLNSKNLFLYCLNNPTNFIDPYGLEVVITINRDTYTTETITSTVEATSTIVDDTYSGYALEARNAGDNRDKSPIFPGVYDAKIRKYYEDENGKIKERDPWRIELKDVDGFTNIQLHPGNEYKHVRGCFATGNERSKNRVDNSVAALRDILDIIKKDGSGNL